MKKSILFIAAASALVLAGCKKQEIANPEITEGQTISLTLEATRGEAADTKTAISYNDEYASLESVWSEGDKIYVYSKKTGAQLGTLTQTGNIINQKSSATEQYSTSYASFSGSVTLGANDRLTDEFAFVYQGAGRSLDVAEGLLTYEIGTSETVAGLNAWDLAYTTGKIQGTAASASCAVSFSNKVGFGYFTTKGLTDGMKVNYYSGFTLDVKSGTVAGVSGTVTLPADKEFYMPLIAGSVNMSSVDKAWSTNEVTTSPYYGKLGYSGGIKQSKSFTAAAGNYYRLGRNAATPFGPVAFEATEWTCYETLKNSYFNVGTEAAPKNVRFTQGNLQYIGSATTPYWRIAETQYSYLGSSNYKPSVVDAGTRMPLDADTDFFGWGEVKPSGNTPDASGNTGFLCSNVNADYQPSIDQANIDLTTDWSTKFNNGTTLYIEQGKEYTGIAGEKYFCLTKTEWQNLFANQWWGGATVTLKDGTKVNGIVICPSSIDEASAKGILGANAVKGATRTKPDHLFDECALDQATVDDNGLLFLPAAGYRNGKSITSPGKYGVYWSTTSSSGTNAYAVYFDGTGFTSDRSYARYFGFPVRLASFAE